MYNKIFSFFLFSILSSVAFADSRTMKWEPSEGAAGYIIYYSSDLGVSWDDGTDIGNVVSTVVDDIPSTGYQLYRVEAYNDKGRALNFESGVFYCGNCAPPPPPSRVSID